MICIIIIININFFRRVRKNLSSLPVRPPAWNNFAPTGEIFMKFYVRRFFKNLSRKVKFLTLTRITGTLHETY
jgi:hypothetical protein